MKLSLVRCKFVSLLRNRFRCVTVAVLIGISQVLLVGNCFLVVSYLSGSLGSREVVVDNAQRSVKFEVDFTIAHVSEHVYMFGEDDLSLKGNLTTLRLPSGKYVDYYSKANSAAFIDSPIYEFYNIVAGWPLPLLSGNLIVLRDSATLMEMYRGGWQAWDGLPQVPVGTMVSGMLLYRPTVQGWTIAAGTSIGWYCLLIWLVKRNRRKLVDCGICVYCGYNIGKTVRCSECGEVAIQA